MIAALCHQLVHITRVDHSSRAAAEGQLRASEACRAEVCSEVARTWRRGVQCRDNGNVLQTLVSPELQ